MRVCLAVILGCAATTPALAQPRPELTIRPQGAVAAFTGETVSFTLGWRPVAEAARYRVTVTNSNNESTSTETRDLRFEQKGLTAGKYTVSVAAIDQAGTAGAASEPLPISVIEVKAVPPGSDVPTAPARGAYAVGTRFSVAEMHCELGNAPIDDLLVGPENVIRVPGPGIATLRCAGVPGYLEKPVVIAPVSIAVQSPRVTRGQTTAVHITLASVAHLGDRIGVNAIGDADVGSAQRTDFGVDVAVRARPGAKTAALSIYSGDFELGRVPLELVDAPPPPPPPPPAPLDWAAFDLGGHAGMFVPPSEGGAATTIGRPTNPNDAVTGGPLVGLRIGFFPTRRVGIEGEFATIAGGYVDQSDVSHLLSTRFQLAVRVVDRGRVGGRLFAGSGTLSTLTERATSQTATQGEIHGGVGLTVEPSPNLWLRFQIADVVTTARDDGYAHCIELQLGLVTRVGRHDTW